MQVFNGVPALEAAVGTHLGYSEWHEITQDQVDQFAQATGDHQWVHVDVEQAKAGPFGSFPSPVPVGSKPACVVDSLAVVVP